jgi:hypothetical protein
VKIQKDAGAGLNSAAGAVGMTKKAMKQKTEGATKSHIRKVSVSGSSTSSGAPDHYFTMQGVSVFPVGKVSDAIDVVKNGRASPFMDRVKH